MTFPLELSASISPVLIFPAISSFLLKSYYKLDVNKLHSILKLKKHKTPARLKKCGLEIRRTEEISQVSAPQSKTFSAFFEYFHRVIIFLKPH